jgi:preprotein translocase subunit YajC
MNYTFLMEIFILVILVLIVGFILFRPISKKELDRYNDKDNWSNMGF